MQILRNLVKDRLGCAGNAWLHFTVYEGSSKDFEAAVRKMESAVHEVADAISAEVTVDVGVDLEVGVGHFARFDLRGELGLCWAMISERIDAIQRAEGTSADYDLNMTFLRGGNVSIVRNFRVPDHEVEDMASFAAALDKIYLYPVANYTNDVYDRLADFYYTYLHNDRGSLPTVRSVRMAVGDGMLWILSEFPTIRVPLCVFDDVELDPVLSAIRAEMLARKVYPNVESISPVFECVERTDGSGEFLIPGYNETDDAASGHKYYYPRGVVIDGSIEDACDLLENIVPHYGSKYAFDCGLKQGYSVLDSLYGAAMNSPASVALAEKKKELAVEHAGHSYEHIGDLYYKLLVDGKVSVSRARFISWILAGCSVEAASNTFKGSPFGGINKMPQGLGRMTLD